MRTDLIETFLALKQAGVRVARARDVDSAEDAIAFAERRNARDPRLLPIVLRVGSDSTGPLASKEEIRGTYNRLRNGHSQIITALDAVSPGENITIVGTSVHGAKVLGVQDRAAQPVPLDDGKAAILVAHVHDYGHQVPPKERSMLEHLFLRLSAFFERPELSAFTLTVRLHNSSYTVTDAAATVSRPLHLHRALGKRGHDQKSDEYHPSGRQ
jgi:hypothetical protein